MAGVPVIGAVFGGGGGGGVAPQINPEVLQAQGTETTGGKPTQASSPAQKKKAGPTGTVLTTPLGLTGTGDTTQRTLLGT